MNDTSISLRKLGTILRDTDEPNFEPIEYLYISSQRERKKEIDKGLINKYLKRYSPFWEIYSLAKEELLQKQWDKNNLLNEIKNIAREMASPKREQIFDFIHHNKEAKSLVIFGERLGRFLAMTSTSTSQLRNAFGQIKALELNLSRVSEDSAVDELSKRKLLMLKPRLAYAAKRQGGEMTTLQKTLDTAIDNIDLVGDFIRFSSYFEAVLAYHKAAGGK